MNDKDYFKGLASQARCDIRSGIYTASVSGSFLIIALIFAICNRGTVWATVGFVAAFMISWFVVAGLADIYLANETIKAVNIYFERREGGETNDGDG